MKRTIQIDSGNVYIAGDSRNAGGADGDMALWRFGDDGTLDMTFNSTGIIEEDLGAGEDLRSVAIDGTGKILATGLFTSGGDADLIILCYNTDGSRDTSFDTDGLVFYDGAYDNDTDCGSSITLDASGRLLVAGTSYNGSDQDMAVWRYNATGALDTTFGTNGVTLIDAGGSDVANAIALTVQATLSWLAMAGEVLPLTTTCCWHALHRQVSWTPPLM